MGKDVKCHIWYANIAFTIFAPYLLLCFYKFAAYLQGANLLKSIFSFSFLAAARPLSSSDLIVGGWEIFIFSTANDHE